MKGENPSSASKKPAASRAKTGKPATAKSAASLATKLTAKSAAKRKIAAARTRSAAVSEPPAPAAPKVRAQKQSGKKAVDGARTVQHREPSFEEVQIRAYLISEQRQSEGRPGDPHGDWIEAERQLRE